MLTHPTLDQLNQLGLFGMAKAFDEVAASGDAAALPHLDWLALLLDREMTYRHDRKLTARLRYARLRHQAAVEDVDYRATRGLDRALFQKLAEGRWIDAHDNVILSGPTGVGKSWLACALGQRACRNNRSVLYQRIPKLFADLALSRGDGRYARLLRALGACNSSYSTTGVSNLSMPPHDMICWKSSKNAMDDDPRSSPASSQSTNGTMSSAIRLMPTPSSIASSTTPTVSISPETACAGSAKSPPKKIDHSQQAVPQLQQPARHTPWATSCRNPWAASSRNARATSSESAGRPLSL